MVLLLNRILQLLKVIKLNTGGNVQSSTFEKKRTLICMFIMNIAPKIQTQRQKGEEQK